MKSGTKKNLKRIEERQMDYKACNFMKNETEADIKIHLSKLNLKYVFSMNNIAYGDCFFLLLSVSARFLL
jgi:hypothetical protein